MQDQLNELKHRLTEVADLNGASSVMVWDQNTHMPPGGAPARARHLGTIQRIAHEKSIAPEIGRLLDTLEPWAETLPLGSDDAALIRQTRIEYDRNTRVPPQLMAEFYAHMAQSYQAWAEARPENDFDKVQPFLEKTLDISRQIAECFPGYEHIADPLIDIYDYGMKASSVRAVFADLRAQLVPMIDAIAAQPLADNSMLHQHFPLDQQRAFGEQIIRAYGYDFNRGRQDTTAHPFMIRFSGGDIRITTRFQETDLGDGLFSTLHESGHAMYEQGIRLDFDGTPLGGGASAGVHESQSRLWENIVGRSLGFWQHYFPLLQAEFPDQLASVSLDAFYRAINRVERSLIRVDADEVTYNLHVIIRFELELQMLEGSLAIKDLPDAWHAAYEASLGLRAPDNRDGCMQDVHWYAGTIGGAFQGYALGNILSAAFYQQALAAHPDIPQQIAAGQFGTLRTWLTDNIYAHGSKYTAPELIERVTGGPLNIGPYMAYLREKYGALYKL